MTGVLGDRYVVTCEHGGNRVPRAFARWFHAGRGVLHSHRGFDRGALQMARDVSRALHAPLHYSTVTRLLVDLNRSVHHRRLHSESIDAAPEPVKQRALNEHYLPYRHAVEARIGAGIARGFRMVHLSCHSFTPRLRGVVRQADIGLLYDPARSGEIRLGSILKQRLELATPGLRVRRNYPYKGTDDGFAPYLRTQFEPERYVGIEIEVNQRWVADSRRWRGLRRAMVASLQESLRTLAASR